MRSAYRVLALLVVLGVFVQAGSIAYGWFEVINQVEAGAVFTSDSEDALNAGHVVHGQNGMMVIPAVALLLLIVSFFAKIRGGVKWAAIVLGLVVLQVVLAFASFSTPILGVLHGVNALAILGTALAASRLTTGHEPATPAPDRSRASV